MVSKLQYSVSDPVKGFKGLVVHQNLQVHNLKDTTSMNRVKCIMDCVPCTIFVYKYTSIQVYKYTIFMVHPVSTYVQCIVDCVPCTIFVYFRYTNRRGGI